MKNEFIRGAELYAQHFVADNMRETDRNEIWAADRALPRQAIADGVETSSLLWTVLVRDVPAAIGGVVPLPTDVHPRGGVCWMLGTDRLQLEPEWFLSESKIILGAMLMDYDYLTNFVDARNLVSLRWLEWLGFEILPPAPWGAEQLPFRQVIKEVAHV